jgi:hypothetical protein
VQVIVLPDETRQGLARGFVVHCEFRARKS